MERGLKIGLPLAALILALGLVANGQSVGVWTSSATGVATGGTMSVTGASTLTGATSIGSNLSVGGTLSVTGASTFTGGATISNGAPATVYIEAGATASEGRWQTYADADSFQLITLTDGDGFGSFVWTVDRSGTTPSSFTLTPRLNSISVQPGFLAYNSASDTGLSTGQSLDFDTVVYDVTGSFVNDTWTAPATGTYQLCTAAKIKPSTTSGEIFITTSNRSYIVALQTTTDDLSGGGCVHADMDANDTATVNVNSAGGFNSYGSGSPYVTWFSGRLVP